MTALIESSIVNIVSDKISAPILAEFGILWGLGYDLFALQSKISTIKDVLQEANEHGIDDMSVYNWLRKLKDVIYDADDLLEKFRMEAEFTSKIHGATKRTFCKALAKINILKKLKMAHKISQLHVRLGAIADERRNFIIDRKGVKEHKIGLKTRETWSMVEEKAVLGREYEKNAIIHELIRTDCQERISIISIVGLGGLGKTTLAQLVYNDDIEVKNHFELRMWVFVSENFNIEAIMRTMIQSATGLRSELEGLDSLGKELTIAIRGKRFLLVLDDVWSHTREMWEKLKLVLENGAKASRIIVTTRTQKVAEQMNTTMFNLSGLPQDVCMEMFTHRVFGCPLSEINTQIAEIAKEIVYKCGGNPLAVKHLGNIMQFKQGVDDWLAVRNSDIWELPGDENKVVIATLKLSYMHLSPVLKECFTYCSILPKGGKINKDELIGQWIAHGMIPTLDRGASLEDTGNEYFNELLQMSFLQDPIKDDNTEVVTCRMHGLVHDLAKSIAGDNLCIIEPAKKVPTHDLRKSYRYLCLVDSKEKVHMSILKRARSLHIYKGDFIIDNGIAEMRYYFIKKKKVKYLRTLVLNPINSIPFPLSIMKLKMLRYLWISKIKCRKLPKGVCSLWSLQSLYVQDCEQLVGLPNEIGKLSNLRTLDLSWCGSLETLPVSIGSCQALQSLILRGCRIIKKISHSLGQLENLRVLNLSCCNELESFPEQVFEKLKKLRNLNLYYCRSITELPNSIGSLQNLQTLNLLECSKIQQLPTSLGTLRSIEIINLSTCKIQDLPDSIGKLENLCNLNLSYSQALTSLPTSISNLQRLRSLILRGTGLSNLPPQISELKNLECLDIEQCSRLRQLPEGLVKMSKLKYLKNKGCSSLGHMPRGIGDLAHLQEMHMFVLDRNPKYASLSELRNLDLSSDELHIRNLQALRSRSEAQNAQLEKKQNLQGLFLEWGGKGMDLNLSYIVLNCLRPNKKIKKLIIWDYPANKYPRWMMVMENSISPFPYLTFLELRKVKCTTLPRVTFPQLKHMFINAMDKLVHIEGQEFPSLTKLILYNMPKLSRWSTIVEGQKSIHRKPAYPRLFCLSIWLCPNLEVHPFVPPTVEQIELDTSNEALLRGLQPNFFETSSSATMLTYYTKKLSIANMTASSGWKLLHHLKLLSELSIQNCCNLEQLPHSITYLSSLRELKVDNCENLNELPEWLGELQSLQRLTIGKCPSLKCFPKSISCLTALEWIVLDDCPALGERCKQEVGEDWHLVSHVPLVFIY